MTLSDFKYAAAGKKAEFLGLGVSNLPLVDFLLNADGLRTQKTVNGKTYDYYWDGGQLDALI